MAGALPWKRCRTARLADADANAAPEPEAEQPASQPGEEPVIAESTAEHSTGAPGILSPEARTPSQVFFHVISDIRDRLDRIGRICGYLLVHNGVLNRMHRANARYLVELTTLQRDMLEILHRVGLQGEEWIAGLEDDGDFDAWEDSEDLQGD